VKLKKSLNSSEALETKAALECFNIRGDVVVLGFGLLEPTLRDRKRRWTSFAVGTAVEAVVIAGICWLAAILPSVVTPPVSRKELWSAKIILATPEESAVPKPPHRKLVPMPETPKPRVSPPLLAAAIPPPLPAIRRAAPIAQPLPTSHALEAAGNVPYREIATPPTPKWQPPVQVGAFGNSSSPTTLHLPARKVQTGGFGDPNGFLGEAQGASHGNVAHLGSFDLPVGPGRGNGSGGARGASGTVASAGFGNGIAGPGEGGTARSEAVQAGGFADAQAAAPAPRAARAPETPKVEPVEVLSKPNPIYTKEARRLRIEGEVLLQVVFTASEELHVIRVVKGLGHGLDEAAVQAAEQIRFKPARRDGRPVDTTATLHVLFQLAN